MAALGARGRARLRPLHLLAAALMAIAVPAPAAADPPTPWPDRISSSWTRHRFVQLPERAANVVIGNPLIAGRLDPARRADRHHRQKLRSHQLHRHRQKGAVLLEKAIEVSGPRDRTVVMYNGAERQTYSCTPDCSRRLTLGDTPNSFDKTLSEITSLNAQATAAGALSSGQIQLDSRSVGTNNSKQQQQ